MESSELIKNFERIRDYLRQFYVYGFKNRTEYDEKSPRSYDNERRRIESWLGDYMFFRRDEGGKQVFLSMDSRTLEHNPLYSAFRAKSFTDRDITLYFYVFDLLSGGAELSLMQMVEQIEARYLSHFPDVEALDVSTLRKKLKEYESLGLLRIRKHGREYLYSRCPDEWLPESWTDALDFFSEAAPLGVVGSFLLDRLPPHAGKFRFKHHYLLHTLDSQILFRLLEAISRHRWVILKTRGAHPMTMYPCRIHISTQTGRQYLLAYHREASVFRFVRLDTIHGIKDGPEEPQHQQILQRCGEFSRYLWGVSVRRQERPDHIEMVLRAEPYEPFILQRLLREKRCGQVEILEPNVFHFQADVYDSMELLPWIRTFIGRIVSLECTNSRVTERFRRDLEEMDALYGGED